MNKLKNPHAGQRIFLYTDLGARVSRVFWHRDLGLLTKAFRDLSHDAWLVVHPASESASEIKNPKSKISNDPVIWASTSDVRNPLWWQSHKPDLVILGLWTRPKYDPIRRAALSATPRIIERADSDGMRTATCGLTTYARRRYDYFRDLAVRWPILIAIPASLGYALASVFATPWMEARLAQTLKLLPAVTVETPLATGLWKKLAKRLGGDSGRIHCVPHPIQTDIFRPNPSVVKRDQIISVGRWESYQKNLPLLLKTLHAFLDQHRTWSSLVIGSGLPRASPHPRIAYSAPLAAAQLACRMQESKIFLSTSRYESFGLAAAEAASCGCLVAGPPGLSLPGVENSFSTSLLGRLDVLAKASAGASVVASVRHSVEPQQVATKFLGILESLGL